MKLSQIVTSMLVLTPGLAAAEPLISAHRGSSFIAPENTLASFNLAWKQNTDAIELDVHLSKDNKLIVLRDWPSEADRIKGSFAIVKDLAEKVAEAQPKKAKEPAEAEAAPAPRPAKAGARKG